MTHWYVEMVQRSKRYEAALDDGEQCAHVVAYFEERFAVIYLEMQLLALMQL